MVTDLLELVALSLKDVLECTDKFWALQSDPRLALDIACYTIIVAHVGLTVGTLAKYASYRSDLMPLVESLLRRSASVDTGSMPSISRRRRRSPGTVSFSIHHAKRRPSEFAPQNSVRTLPDTEL